MSSFDFLARHYNAMTGYPGRIDTLANSIRPWVEEWKVQAALDAGCGGGALMFALDNCDVVPAGLDSSEPMLRLAMANARERGKRFRFIGAPHYSAGSICPLAFDAVFCLGNAIISEADDREMIASLSGLLAALKPGGHLLIQILNLTPFFLGLKTLIARRSVNGFDYIRVASPDGDRLIFCAMAIGPGNDVDARFSVWPRWEKDRLVSCVYAAGFREIAVFGSLERAEFNSRSSADLVISARRPKN